MAEWSKALDSKSSLRSNRNKGSNPFSSSFAWIGGRVVEGARLEIVYTSKGYRGFESHPLRSRQRLGDVTWRN